MKFKYHTEILRFNCNLKGFTEKNRIAFRWVFEDLTDRRNFEPVYIDPARAQKDCKGYALSFYDDQSSAKSQLLYFTKDKENLFKKLGTHIAKGQLIESDGVSEDSDDRNHFNHFEYENIDLKLKFSIAEKIIS